MIGAAEPPVGHEDVLARLEAAAAAVRAGEGHRLAHAWVFCGPSGVGKFKAASWWAGRLKCAEPSSCNGSTCVECKRVAAGSHPDVCVVAPPEPGRAIPIASIRDLIHAMALRPMRPGPRIAIVRDAQQLTFEAQGAMLKLLEEPPGFAVLALVTRNPSALLATIRSRCQTLRFAPLAPADVRRVLEAHGREAALASRAAAMAAGSPGAALALTAEAVEDRAEVITAFEAVRSGKTREVETLAAALAERRKQGRPGVEALLAWQLRKVQVSLRAAAGAQAEAEEDNLLASLLASAADEPADVLLDEAAGTLWAVQALERNGNPKLVLRELLLGIRDRDRAMRR